MLRSMFDSKNVEKPFTKFEIDYMGGHKLYPKKSGATVGLFSDHIDIGFGLVHRNAERAQQSIYNRMIEARSK